MGKSLGSYARGSGRAHHTSTLWKGVLILARASWRHPKPQTLNPKLCCAVACPRGPLKAPQVQGIALLNEDEQRAWPLQFIVLAYRRQSGVLGTIRATHLRVIDKPNEGLSLKENLLR